MTINQTGGEYILVFNNSIEDWLCDLEENEFDMDSSFSQKDKGPNLTTGIWKFDSF